MSNLSIVVCGAPLALLGDDLADAAVRRGWDVTVLVTDAATAWIRRPASGFRRPADPKPPRPDAVVVCPMTFNTGNKWAQGIADTYPTSLLAECLGAGKPIVAVPCVNDGLWGHPRWAWTLETLGAAGVEWVDPVTGEPAARPLEPEAGDVDPARFEPEWVLDRLEAKSAG